jgi:hypothetical protein
MTLYDTSINVQASEYEIILDYLCISITAEVQCNAYSL